MARMQTPQPARKVIGSTLAGALTTLVVWFIDGSGIMPDPIPAPVATALTTILAFLVGYYLPPSATDQVLPD